MSTRPTDHDLERHAVLHAITDTDRRGAQVFATELADQLTEQRLRVRTVALAPGQQPNGLPVEVLGRSRLGPHTLLALRTHVRRAGVVVGFGSATLPACAAASLGTGTPFVYRSIGDLRFWARTPARRARVRLALRRTSAVVCLWSGAARVLADQFGVPPASIHVIPRGVPARRFPPVQPSRRPEARHRFGLTPDLPTVLFLGSLTKEKDVAAAIDALAGLPGCQLLVAGDGPERASLEAQAQCALPGRGRFVGVVQDAAEALAAADLLVLPSLSEGMPGVLIEAGLCGLPSVATAVGGTPDVIVPGVTGELVAPGDRAALREAVATVLMRREAYGAAARQRCLQRFEITVVAERWRRLLLDVAGDPPP